MGLLLFFCAGKTIFSSTLFYLFFPSKKMNYAPSGGPCAGFMHGIHSGTG
jgi:hypothetical protein